MAGIVYTLHMLSAHQKTENLCVVVETILMMVLLSLKKIHRSINFQMDLKRFSNLNTSIFINCFDNAANWLTQLLRYGYYDKYHNRWPQIVITSSQRNERMNCIWDWPVDIDLLQNAYHFTYSLWIVSFPIHSNSFDYLML